MKASAAAPGPVPRSRRPRSPHPPHPTAIDEANRAVWDRSQQDPEESLHASEGILADALAADYPRGTADAWLNIGWCYYYLSRLPEAFGAFTKAEAVFGACADIEGSCKVLNALGVYHQELSRLDKAIDYYTRSLEAARKAGLHERERVAMNNIGELCLELGNPKEALDYLVRSYETMTEETPTEMRVDTLLNIGKAFSALGNNPLAEEFTKKALETAKAANEAALAVDCLATLGTVAIEEGRLDDADGYLSAAFEMATGSGARRQLARVLVARGSLLMERGRFAEAIAPLEEAARLADEIQAKAILYRTYERLARAFESTGNDKAALEYFKRFAHYRSEVQSEDTAQKVRSLQVQAEIEKAQQEAEIHRLRNIELKARTDELAEANRQIVSISEIGRRVTACLEYDALVRTLYENLQPLLSMDFFGIALYEAESHELVYRSCYEDGERKSDWRIEADADDSFMAWAYRNRTAVLIRNKDEEYARYLARPSRTRGYPCQSIVCLPLILEDRTLGGLMVQNRRPSAYSPRHLELLEALVPYVAIAVENSIIHDRLEELNRALSDEKQRLERATRQISHLANHDTLTGLPNRRLLFELLGNAIESARRTGDLVGVAFLDLDDFKSINDRLGHAAGDAVLVAMAERFRGLLRASDIVSRVGGDEFVIVFNNVERHAGIGLVAAKVLAECTKPLPVGERSFDVGFSMGIAAFPDDGDAIDTLLSKADAAMYRVKRADKNGFAFYDPGDPATTPPTGEAPID